MNKMQTALVKEIKKVSQRVDEVWHKIMNNKEGQKDEQKESIIELDNEEAHDKEQNNQN